MRIAILSDIHSNLQSLTKAFSIIDELKVDKVYCLGDIVGYGGNPNECLSLVRKRAAACVLGNHDLGAIDTSQAEYFTRPGRTAAQWTNSVLSDDNKDFLSKLPYRAQVGQLTLVHANPAEPTEWTYITSLEDAALQFPHFETDLCFIGHTHIPSVCGEDLKTFQLKKGVRSLVNVGSVGQPRDGNPQLSFGMLDTEVWNCEIIRVDYDIRGAADAILKNGLPPFLADRLFKGI